MSDRSRAPSQMSTQDIANSTPAADRPGSPVVALTRPPALVLKSSVSSGSLTPPLGLAYLAASLREAGFGVSIVDPIGEDPFKVNLVANRPLVTCGWSSDEVAEAIPPDSQYIGVACGYSQEWPIAKELARKIRVRFPKATLILGGEHVTAVPEFSLRDCRAFDYGVLGEGEETLVDLVTTLSSGGDVSSVAGLVYAQNGSVTRTMPRRRVREVDEIPWPAWDLVPLENYLERNLRYGVGEARAMPILATRGCPFACTFCSSPGMWMRRWYPRSPRNIVEEMKTYIDRYQVSNFDFSDLTVILRRDWIVKFCQEIIDQDLKISWQVPAGTRSEAVDDDVASLLACAGHRNIVYAPETGSERMLRILKKKVDLKNMIQSMRDCVRQGMSVKLNMIMGFPGETPADIRRTYSLLTKAARIGVDDAVIATFIPYPGSEIFDDLQRGGRLPDLDDEFFFQLTSLGDVKGARSFAEGISGRALLRCKMWGQLLFYLVSFFTHPSRFVRTVWHLYRHDHHTRLEKALSALVSKARRFRHVRAHADDEAAPSRIGAAKSGPPPPATNPQTE